MIRTLQLAGIHGWVSLRLTASRKYWLPRLTMATIAGYALLFSSQHFHPDSWSPVAACMLIGVSCLPLSRSDLTGKNLPLPIPRRTLAVASIAAQILVCVGVAFIFMLAQVGSTFLLALELNRLSAAALGLPAWEEVVIMGGIVAAGIPFALATVFGWSHARAPHNAWPNRRWTEVLPRLVVATVGLTFAVIVADQVAAHPLLIKYLQVWLGGAVIFTGGAVFFFGWTGIFPDSDDTHRPALPAVQQLRRTIWRSQVIKWAVLVSGLALYMVSADWIHHRARPILICYAALLPFFTMPYLVGGEALVGTERHMGMWRWARSGWRLVPIPRVIIQRALLLDTIGFAAAAIVILHAIAILAAQVLEPNPNVDSWVQDLHNFTWTFTWFTGFALPVMVLTMTPRRHFGIAPAVVALLATLWAARTAIGGALSLSLPVDNHAIILASWVILTAVMLAQFSSPSSRLFDTSAPVGQASRRAGIILTSRVTLWSLAAVFSASAAIGLTVHRSLIRDATEQQALEKMTSTQVDRLIRDLQRIAGLNVLDMPTRTRDAGELLNPYIGLDDGTPALEDVWWSDVNHKRMLNRPTHWSTAPDDIEIGDLSILKQLMAYDHWEAGRLPSDDATQDNVRGAYDAYLRDVPHKAYLSTLQPAPNPLALVDLAKFRLLQGLRTGDVLPALQEVRHLARLIHSDETVVHTVMAIAILRFERRAFEAATDRGLLASTDWTSPNEEDLNAMHRVVVTKAYMLAGGADAAQWERIAALGPDTFGLCAAIHDAVSIEMTYPTITLWPGEVFPTRVMPLTEPTLAASGCSLPLARNTLARSRGASMSMIPEDAFYRIGRLNFIQRLLSSEFSRSTLMMLHVPYLRGHAWTEVAAHVQLTGFSMYGERPEDDWNGVRVLHQPGPGAPAE